MNEFEQNVQSKRNDLIDSGVAFIVSFGFFAALFTVGTIISVVGS
ncbi:YqzM family protein [Jeotgalibacillus malaysiensis]